MKEGSGGRANGAGGDDRRRPFFSVVMNAFNSAGTLNRAIDSVLQQEPEDFELVVVDDGSTDATPLVLASYRDRSRVRIERQANAKCAAARQKGVDLARGEYVVFLDSDDEALPGWLATLGQCLRETGADVVSAGVRTLLPRGRERSRMPVSQGRVLNDLVGLFLAGSFAVRRELLLAVGGYAAGTEPVDHTDFLHRLAGHSERTPTVFAAVMKEVVIVHREAAVPYHPQALLKGALHLLRTYPEHYRRDPVAKSTCLSIAGVNAARLGDWPQARALFGAARAQTPNSVKCRLRVWIAGVPLVAARVWRQPVRRARLKG